MKKNEVKLWMNYHASLFLGWKYSAESNEANAIAFEAYAKALYRVELGEAKAASDAMLSGNLKKPFKNEDHLSAIVSYCRKTHTRSAPKYIDGQKVTECKYCEDTGFVLCWKRDLANTMAVACSCHQGERHAKPWRHFNAPEGARVMEVCANDEAQRYDPLRCFRVGDDSQHWKDILSGEATVKPENYESAFEQFNGNDPFDAPKAKSC